MSSFSELKSKIIHLLRTDEEFRYAVAGLLGLDEILRRLDEIGRVLAEHSRILDEHSRILSEHSRILNEHSKILVEHSKILAEHGKALSEILRRLDEHERILNEHTRILNEHTRILNEHSKMLAEHGKRLEEHSVRLDEHSRKLDELIREVRTLRKDVNDIKRSLERVMLTLEDEAREVISYRLRSRLGVDVKLGRLELQDLELNIYGASDDLVVIGECTVRLGSSLIQDLLRKLDLLRRRNPELLRPRVVLAIYTMVATEDAVRECEKNGVWLNTIKEELTKPRVL